MLHSTSRKSPIERFTDKINVSSSSFYEGTPCWMWTASRTRWGYGRFSDDERRVVCAHRWSYEYFIGPIPAGLTIDHLCRNPACVNPIHLEAVTMRVNNSRADTASTINARKTHCIHGHPFDPENTRIGKDGRRTCRSCERVAACSYRQRKKGRDE